MALPLEGWPELAEPQPPALALKSDPALWPCFGIPESIAIDNGKDYLSMAFKKSCLHLGIEIINCPPRRPWFKAVIERFGRTINVRLIHWLKGTTKGLIKKHIEYDAQKAARIHVDDFFELLDQYVVDIHNHSPRRNKRGTPLQRWLEGIAKYPPRLPISKDEFDATVALHLTRVLRQNGISYMYLQYNNMALGKIWHHIGDNKPVSIRVNPLDLTSIFVIDPRTDEAIRVECTTPFTYPPQWDYHIDVCQETRRVNNDPAVAHHRTQAERRLREKVGKVNKKSKSPARRKKAVRAEAQRAQSNAPLNKERAGVTPSSFSVMDDFLEASRGSDD